MGAHSKELPPEGLFEELERSDEVLKNFREPRTKTMRIHVVIHKKFSNLRFACFSLFENFKKFRQKEVKNASIAKFNTPISYFPTKIAQDTVSAKSLN